MTIDAYVKSQDGFKLHFRYYKKDKPTLFLIHGLTMDIDSWHHQIEYFKNDFSILAYDLRGHGQTEKPKCAKSYTLEKFVEDIETLNNHLEIKKFSLLGFSLGGTIAMKYSQKHPEKIEKLVTINAPYKPTSIKTDFFVKLAAMEMIPNKLARGIMKIGLDKDPVWKYKGRFNTHRKTFMMADINVVNKIMWAMKSYKPFIDEIKVPHLLIYSSDDEIVKPDAPVSTNLKIIDGGHHYVIAQKHKEVNNILKKYLKK